MSERATRRSTPGAARLLAALLAVAAVLLSGCTGPAAADLPPAPELLTRSADAMRQVKSVALDIQVDPALFAIPVRAASGSLTAGGDATGKATLAQGAGAPVEFTFLVTGGQLYLKGPTGGFNPPIPVSVASRIYDPTAVLDPERGVARLLATATPGATAAKESVDGVEAYKVPAHFEPQAVGALVPGVVAALDGVIWIDAATSRLVRADLQVPGRAGGGTAPVVVRLGDYDAPVTVTPPG